jgi:hypothetical protein
MLVRACNCWQCEACGALFLIRLQVILMLFTACVCVLAIEVARLRTWWRRNCKSDSALELLFQVVSVDSWGTLISQSAYPVSFDRRHLVVWDNNEKWKVSSNTTNYKLQFSNHFDVELHLFARYAGVLRGKSWRKPWDPRTWDLLGTGVRDGGRRGNGGRHVWVGGALLWQRQQTRWPPYQKQDSGLLKL